MKKLLKHKVVVNLAKFALAVGIIGYLIVSACQHEKFPELIRARKDWSRLTVAAGMILVGTLITFFRWQILVRALGFPFTAKDSLRLGFLGYLFNFVAPGGVGGDLFKAVFIARQYHGRRAQAVATVFIDRVVGLYALFVVAATVVLLDGLMFVESRPVRIAAKTTVIGTVLGALGIVMLLVPGFTSGRLSRFLGNLPRTGPIFRHLLDAVRMYRERLGVVVAALGLSVVVHVLSCAGFYLLGEAIPGNSPSAANHFVIVPLAMVVGAVPITPAGLGTFEFSMDELYQILTGGVVEKGRGLLVSLVYRVITIAIAMVGVVYYFFARREVSAALHEAEEADEATETKTNGQSMRA